MEANEIRMLVRDGNLASLITLICDEAGIVIGQKPNGRVPLVIDLDSAELPADIKYSCIIAISRDPEGTDDKIARRCRAILQRPFRFEDLIETILDALENAGTQTYSAKRAAHPSIKLGQTDHDITCGKRRASLTPSEFVILRALLDAKGDAVGYDELCSLIGGGDASNKLGVHICSLRKKLNEVCGTQMITTLRNVGYKI